MRLWWALFIIGLLGLGALLATPVIDAYRLQRCLYIGERPSSSYEYPQVTVIRNLSERQKSLFRETRRHFPNVSGVRQITLTPTERQNWGGQFQWNVDIVEQKQADRDRAEYDRPLKHLAAALFSEPNLTDGIGSVSLRVFYNGIRVYGIHVVQSENSTESFGSGQLFTDIDWRCDHR